MREKLKKRSRTSSLNVSEFVETASRKAAAMSDQPLSPAKKLAKLMRERPLKGSPKAPSSGVSRMSMKGSDKAQKQNAKKAVNADASCSAESTNLQMTRSATKPMRDPRSRHDTNISAQAPVLTVSKKGKGSGRDKLVANLASVTGSISENGSVGKQSKQKRTSAEGKHPKRQKVAGGSHACGTEVRRTGVDPCTSSPGKRRRRGSGERRRGAGAGAPQAAAGDIAALLRLGEGAASAAAGPLSDDSDWEAVDAPASDLATKGFVEVTLPSDVAMQKKKKKGFDVEAYMKRQLSRARRELQQLVHKTHLLCLLSRTLQLNALLNSETPLACAMSMLPSKYAYPPKRVSLSYVEKFLKWFREKVPLEAAAEGGRPSEDVFRTLELRLCTKKAHTPLELVCLFVLILRAIGVDCRLVMSLQPAPLRPPPPPAGKTTGRPPKNAAKTAPKAAQQLKQNRKKEAKSSNTGKKADLAAGASKTKRVVSMPPARTGSARKAKQRASVSAPAADSSADSSEEEFEPRRRPERRVLSSDSSSGGGSPGGSEGKARTAADCWAEVYVEEELRWISVDVIGGGVHCVAQIRRRATAPLAYVLGCDNAGHLKDLTARYDPKWHSSTRRLRVEQAWWAEATGAWRAPATRRDTEEDEQMARELQERPIPQSIAELKDHPLYALERHLLKFEAIYPPSAVPLGYIGKGERRVPVFARECVRTLHARETWIKQARVVKDGEKPYKIVKARPKWDRLQQKLITDKPLEVFGRWQTGEYVPPRAAGGKVPRNDYGNVELFQPSMLPGGTVHLIGDGLSRVAKRLGIDCAPAMVGWDFHCGGSHPVFEGYVVCEEFEDTLMDAWEADQREARRRQREKRQKRVLDNWRRLMRGLLIRQRLHSKYNFETAKRPADADRPAKKARTPTAKRRKPEPEPEPDPQLPVKPEPGRGKARARAEPPLKSEPDSEPPVKPEPGRGKARAQAEPRPAASLSARLSAKMKAEPEPEPGEGDGEETPESQEAVSRRLQESLASMGLRRVALSSDSEADSDAETSSAAAGPETGSVAATDGPPAAAQGGRSGSVAAARGARSGSVAAARGGRSGEAAAQSRRRPPAWRRSGRSSPADSPPPPPAAGDRSSRRRSGRPVSYRETAGSGSEAGSGGEAPAREEDLSSDEEQPFVRAAALSSDDDDDFMGF